MRRESCGGEAVRRAWLAGSLLLGAACSNDPDALYAHGDGGKQSPGARDGGRAVPKAGDILSLYADLGTDGACVACMRNECADA